jgi:hypothetical protein
MGNDRADRKQIRTSLIAYSPPVRATDSPSWRRRQSVGDQTPRSQRATEYDKPGISALRQYLAEQDAHDQAAEFELRYDARGYRSADTVQRVDPPVPVKRAWQLAGVLDAWVRENGEWIGRIRRDDGRIVWIRAAELRQTKGA